MFRLSTLLQPEYIANPYPFYHQLRDHDPVYWEEEMQSWFFTRYSDVMAILRTQNLFPEGLAIDISRFPPSVQAVTRPTIDALARHILALDSLEHSLLRRLIGMVLAPQVVDAFSSRIQQCMDRVLVSLQRKGELEVIREVAYPFTSRCMLDLFGIAEEDRQQCSQWTRDYMDLVEGNIDAPKKLVQALFSVGELVSYLRKIIAQRGKHPKDDFLQALIRTQEQEGILQSGLLHEEDLLINYALLLIVGQKTVVHTISNGLLALLQHPEQLQQLKDDPTLFAPAITEILRYDGPVKILVRFAREDCEIGGKSMKAGQRIIASTSAANRDPEYFSEPDTFDMHRLNKRYLSFGHGMHNCLGAYLARMQVQIALSTLFRRFDTLQLSSRPLEWSSSLSIRGLKQLPLTVF